MEISRLEQIDDVIQSGADIVMLDNFSPKDAKKANKIIRSKKNKEQLIIEASGNISIENIEQYAKSGVDIISLGRITHSVKNIDMSLEIIKNYS
uniref:Nicotinate-nucleotide pyrophosphorylase (NadC, QPRT) n=1 Tax=uncultured marine thaumarchaeote AD1000_24_H07 TaxID=1455902 RepID=A0A075FSH2_9ARCH|nr:nicotinate-nucleotide pyrophosphorylase (nadC, QPRT) [uncultured marine thaumarchaeote AD1000_24_H07]